MEERRGESSDAWMKKSGISKSADLVLTAEAKRSTIECDEMGIDSSWPLADRVARLQDIHQGSPLMHEERQRKAKHLDNQPKDNTFKSIYGDVMDGLNNVKSIPVETKELPKSANLYQAFCDRLSEQLGPVKKT